jgi:hypothetical protein
MLRWVLVLVLVMASAIAQAQTVPPSVVDQAQTREGELDRAYHQQLNEQHRLQAQFADQTSAIDKMKQRRRSWANDRELNTTQADANETAQRLAAVAQDLKATADKLATARKALIDAIDVELAGNPAADRRQALTATRARIAPQVAAAPHKIVVPNSDIDPTADPEDLERQAAALKQTDDELARQQAGLATQAKDLDDVAKTRKEHDRAQDVAYRDDDQSHRTTTTSHGNPTTQAPVAGGGAGGGNGQVGLGGGTGSPTNTATNPSAGNDRGLSDATVVLADVVDASTIQQLRRAQSSNDPGQRAIAAKQAEAAVAARREQLRKKREAIEARAKQLRGGN